MLIYERVTGLEKEKKGFHNRKAEWPELWKELGERFFNYKQLILFSSFKGFITNKQDTQIDGAFSVTGGLSPTDNI